MSKIHHQCNDPLTNELLKVFGLDGSVVRKFQLTVEAGCITTVNVELFAHEKVHDVVELIKKYCVVLEERS